ncbi:MAG: right-handed parallel beta-helix repeat-containing protein [Clostridiales bacterium]|nr:right-handed parallel beta-helix repeat-containing protein [Clostridiales bacterium]
MQSYYSISTIFVGKELPFVENQKGRGKYVTSIEDAVRVCCDLRRSGILQPLTVRIASGRYELARTLEFSNDIYSVTFESQTGKAEDVILSGGQKIEGFTETVFNGKKCVVAYLPQVKEGKMNFSDFYVNGERATLSRFPAEGYLQFAEAENMGLFLDDISKWIRLKKEDVKDLSAEDIRNATLSYLHYWVDEHTAVESYDEETGVLVMDKYSRFGIYGEKTESAYYFENVSKTFGKPGEWYLDKAEGKLYYVLREGECVETLDAYIPYLSSIANFTGASSAPIKNIVFKNVTFAYTKGEHESVNDSGLRVASDGQGVSEAKGTVNFEYAENCALIGCKFVNYGLHGVNVGKGCSYISVRDTFFYDGGAGGVIMGGADANGDVSDRTHSNEIIDCVIRHCGRRHMAACGVLIKHAYNNKIVGNEISDLYYTGISAGWVWGYKESVTRDNYIAYNHIFDLGKRVLSDMGGVYLLGAQPGTVVCNNHIHDVYGREYGGWALYTDEGSACITLEKNICYRCSDNCIHQHYGRMNVVKNNIFAFAEKALCCVTWGELHLSTVFENNILITNGELVYNLLAREHVENGTVATGNNLLWSINGSATDVFEYCGKKYGIEDAQRLGFEVGSVYADPKCKDIKNYDFTVAEDSPAYALGFQPITLK